MIQAFDAACLGRLGVGYKSVSVACDVASSKLSEIRSRRTLRIRASTERRILDVTPEVSRADGAKVAANSTNLLLVRMLDMGFRRRELAGLLGYSPATNGLQLGKRKLCLLATKVRVERLWRRVKAREILPKVWGPRGLALDLLHRGIPAPTRSTLGDWQQHLADLERANGEEIRL